MSADQINAELEKLTRSQRTSMRAKFPSGIAKIQISQRGRYTEAHWTEVNGVSHVVMITRRGRLCDHREYF